VSLRGYQAFGAKFALVQRKVILGDEMGLGKTIEALAAFAHLRSIGATHFVTVSPASVLVNWIREIRARTELDSFRLHGNERDHNLRRWTEKGGIAVTTFESLRSMDPPDEVKLSMLVVDEAHYVKNPDALRTKRLQPWIQAAERTLFLTGTPLENRLDEFRNLVSYLQPEALHTISGTNAVAGPSAFRKAVAPVYLRRNQTDVLTELPERLEVDDWVELLGDDFSSYRDAVASGNFMAMRRAAYMTERAEASAKLARLVDIIEESEASGWKVVVFSYFHDVLRAVGGALKGSSVFGPLTGRTSPDARQELVERFSDVDGHAVLLGQIQAGGTGLNIQAASVVVLTEPQWKPTMEEQAIARCHRMGQVRRVHVHRLLAKDSVDERMLEIIAQKQRLFDEYVRDSVLKDASPEAVDVSEVEAARRIVAMEQARLGVEPVPAVEVDPDSA
jgi:SNF2 family DNA or RNA helicase